MTERIFDKKEFFEERLKALKLQKKAEETSLAQFEEAIETHKALIEVVNENKDRFAKSADIVAQYEGIIQRFEYQTSSIKVNLEKTDQLIDAIENMEDYTVEAVLISLLSVSE